MAVTGRIPKEYIDEDVEAAADGKPYTLTALQLNDIFKEYCRLYTKLDVLWELYKWECRKYNPKMPNSCQVNFADWTQKQKSLSAEDKKMLVPLDVRATSYSRIVRPDEKIGRKVVYSKRVEFAGQCDSSVVFCDVSDPSQSHPMAKIKPNYFVRATNVQQML